ncbi:MAG: hypothetical protein J6R26_06665 [Paludibacteraceae bacterium]|jgi:hypothetical protein|nr:hypothetical protein [Paludibacteraceae bacterium]
MFRFFPFILLFLALVGCENYLFYFPDNFPQERLYSYLPYSEGDTLLYANHKADTMRLVIKSHYKDYLRAQRHNGDHVMENGSVITELTNSKLHLTVSCACLNRQRFEAKLTNQKKGYNPQVLGLYIYEQEEMSDYIFNQFVNELSLSEGQAMIKRNRGLVMFTDLNSVRWDYVGKRIKKGTK